MCRPDSTLLVADLALDAIPGDIDSLGGLTLGADPVAYGVAAVGHTQGQDLRWFAIRKEVKDHGVSAGSPERYEPGDPGVVTEDAVTTSTSPLEAAFRHASSVSSVPCR